MSFIIQSFISGKLFLLSNLLLFRVLCSKLIGINVIMHKIMSLLPTCFKHVHHILTTELTGVSAFNYSEITIIIGVLGIVATNTIPQFYTVNERNMIISRLQRDYAVYSGGINLAISENGTPDNWGLVGEGDASGLANINSVVSKYFKISKNCGTGTGCFPDIKYKNLKGIDNDTNLNQDSLYTKFLLTDGTSIAITQWNDDCGLDWGNTHQLKNVCGLFVFDVNGAKSPNTYGKDFFGFALTKTGLVPLGSQSQNGYPFNGFCNRNSNANFKYENGLSCTAWVLYKKNMDYLDCQGLNWNGKSTCKA